MFADTAAASKPAPRVGRHMPRQLWRWQIDVEHVANLAGTGALADIGLPPPRPTQAEWPRVQQVGERLWREGYRGVLTPSAARPACLVLCLFREAEEIPGATPLRPPTTYRRAPPPPRGKRTYAPERSSRARSGRSRPGAISWPMVDEVVASTSER
jgi:RES domain-containing protein